jgi:hypothetical protein
METLDTYIGIEPFTVKVDNSPQLQELVKQARGLRTLPFPERLAAVKKIAIDSMVNAYEQMIVWGKKAEELEVLTVIGTNSKIDQSENEQAKSEHIKYKNIVFQKHPLSYALEQKAGCCRYQGALFFVLGYEADLGDKHFIQAAPVNRRANSVFNELKDNRESHIVSIFTASLQDKSLDYSRQNPKIFEQAFKEVPGLNMYSYHRLSSGLAIATNPSRHVKNLD